MVLIVLLQCSLLCENSMKLLEFRSDVIENIRLQLLVVFK